MSPDAENKRLFVGTFLSGSQQDSINLAEHKTELENQWHCRVRLVKSVKLHLTWLFLGDVKTAQVPEIQAKLETIVSSSKRLSLDYNQIEFWPSAKRVRMVVLTPAVVPAEVVDMSRLVASELNSYVVKPSERKYRPHITLARLDGDALDAQKFQIPDWLATKCHLPITHNVDKLELIESELGRNADEYKSIGSFNLSV